MGRPLRAAAGGIIYHVLNRANGRQVMFETPQDYQLWEQVLQEAQVQVPVRILAYCVMPNHWHLVLWPRRDGDLSRFM
ncbi:MAG: transposase, partial [Nitrospirota bacterium]|nr:transposase [Nitrospirota bacterium]